MCFLIFSLVSGVLKFQGGKGSRFLKTDAEDAFRKLFADKTGWIRGGCSQQSKLHPLPFPSSPPTPHCDAQIKEQLLQILPQQEDLPPSFTRPGCGSSEAPRLPSSTGTPACQDNCYQDHKQNQEPNLEDTDRSPRRTHCRKRT